MDEDSRLMNFVRVEEDNGMHWTRGVAAGSMVMGALLLITGRRGAGLAVAAAGAGVALLENPAAVRDFWNTIPEYVHSGQDFLARAEGLIDDVNRQTERLRSMISREA